MSNPLPPHLQSNQPLGADDAERAMRNAVFSAAPGSIEQRSLRKATPVANIPLPSQGLVYPPTAVLHKKDTIDIKHMTPREEDILLNKAYARKGTIITELVKACVIDKNIDVDSLLMGDRTAILIGIRATGYGSEYKVKIDCPKCENSSDVSVDLASLPTKDLNLTKVQQAAPYTNAFLFKLPMSGKVVTYKFLCGTEVDSMFAEMREKLRQKLGAPTPITNRLMKQIIAVDGDASRFAISDFIESMEGRDSLALRHHVDTVEPGVELTHEFVCDNPECEHKEVLGFSLDEHFFYPNAKR